jgi:SAM-dependent methyltransferase
MQAKLYSDLAPWWPLVSRPADYAEEAGQYAELLGSACRPRRVLELGSGGGNNACHMKKRFELTLVDLSPQMLEVSRILNPECSHLEGDMRSIRLGRRFDAVFVHDALSYLTTADDLYRAIETAFAHCRPGGASLLVPDWFRETFRPRVSAGGHDGEGRSLRYLEWTYDPDASDTTAETDFAFLLRSGSGPARAVHDHHTMGLFERELWLDLCRRAGFEPGISTVRDTHLEVVEREVILCRRPASRAPDVV